MRRRFSLTARSAILSAVLLLVAGAVGVGILAYRAASVEKPDLIAPVAAETANRAEALATALDAHLLYIGALLQSLADKGAAKAGGGNAMRLASKAFKKNKGLEQLAPYGPNGKTRWIMRPAGLGRIMLPKDRSFVAAHMAQPEQKLRLASPFKPSKRGQWWAPVTLYAEGKNKKQTAVIVAFVRSDTLQPFLSNPGGVAALFTDQGVLARAEPQENAPVGASFAEAPGFLLIDGQPETAGTYVGGGNVGPAMQNIVGFHKLSCCGAIVTAVAPAPPPVVPEIMPSGRWFALAAAGLMILLAIGIIGRKLLTRTPDPWRDFGQEEPQSVT